MAQRKSKPAEAPQEPVVGEQEQVIEAADVEIIPPDDQETQIIRVIGLPEIIEKMELISQKFKSAVVMVSAMAVTEESLVVARSTRSDIRKAFDAVDGQRKAAKEQYAAPWNAFEQRYKELIYNEFLEADKTIKAKIDDVSDGVKQQKEADLAKYFAEYCAAQNVIGIKLSGANIKVNFSDTISSLKKQAKAFVDRVGGELAAIATMPNSDEIIVEYEIDYNFARAVKVVTDRYAAIEKAKKEREAREEAERQRQERAAQVQTAAASASEPDHTQTMGYKTVTTVAAPTPMVAPVVTKSPDYESTPEAAADEDPEVYEFVFMVQCTKAKARDLKKLLDDGGYVYECE